MNPGDPQAREEGCTCPRDMNRDGKGAHLPNQDQSKTFFVIERDCPMHGVDHS